MLEPHVSTKGDTGRTVLTVLGMVAEMERGFIKSRQRDGIAKAKAEGVYKGGKTRIDAGKVLSLRQVGKGPSEIARELGGSRTQVHCILKAGSAVNASV